MGDDDDDAGDQHGALVKKMIDSKKQLEHGSEIAGQRSEVVRKIFMKLFLLVIFIRKQWYKMMLNVDVKEKKFKKMLINFEKQFNH